jgi:hypothetical protein
VVRFHAAAMLLALLILALVINAVARGRVATDLRWVFGALALILLVGLLEAAARRSLSSAALEDDNLLYSILGAQSAIPLASVCVVGRTRLRLGPGSVRVIQVQVPSKESGRPRMIHFLPRTDRSEGLLTIAVARAVQPRPAPSLDPWSRRPESGHTTKTGRRASRPAV